MQTHIRSSNVIVVLTSFLLTFVAPRLAAADTLTLMWNANPAPEVAGYIAHVGTQSGTYTQHFDVGQGTAFTFTTAVPGQRYCFAVSSYAAGPIEGPNSAEVCAYSNTAPVLVNPGTRQSTLGQASSLQLAGSDPDSQPVTYSATGLPPGLSLMASTGFVSGTPTAAGSYNVTATVSDGVLTVSQTFTWTIVATDTTVPSVAIASPTSAATYTTATATLTLSGSAADNVGVTQVTWSNNRGGSGTASGATSWSVTGIALQSGVNVLTVIAQDAAGNTSSDALTVTYNLAPALASVGNQTTSVGQAVLLQLAGSDPNGGDLLTYSGTGLPPGLSVSAATGLISGAPTTTGSYAVTVTVSDGSLSASRAFTWTIVATVDTVAPTVTIAAPTSAATYATSSATVTLSGTSSDNVSVTQVSWVSNRGGSGTTTGRRNWNTGAITLQDGVNILTVTARDAAGNTGSDVLTVTKNVAPTLASVANQSTGVGQWTTLQLVGGDANGDPLTFSATGLPSGLSVTASTGLIAGISTTGGTYSVTATVSDGALSASRTFTWTTTPDTTAPVVTITGPTTAANYATSGTTLSLSGTASDNLAVTQVSWVNSRGGSGVATGTTAWNTATLTLLAGTNVVTVTARDAAGNTATGVLTVTYNVVPALASVANQSTGVGQAVTLQLAGTDVNNDPLTYTATGLPPGLSLASSSGLISGSPTAAGTYTVTVTVSDGTLTASRTFTWTTTLVDASAPSVTITGPTSATTYTASTATLVLSGTAADNAGVTQVTWSNSLGGSGTAVGTTNWSVSSLALQIGANVITVTARDAAGNTATDVLTVSYAAGPLQFTGITANRVSPQPAGTAITFTATGTGGTAPYQYKFWLFDGTTWVIARDWATSATFTWTPASANANYRIGVWMRSAGSTADVYDAALVGSMAFSVQ